MCLGNCVAADSTVCEGCMWCVCAGGVLCVVVHVYVDVMGYVWWWM